MNLLLYFDIIIFFYGKNQNANNEQINQNFQKDTKTNRQ